MKAKVRLDTLDEELLFKRLAVDMGEYKIFTPSKAGNKFSEQTKINEIYKKLDLKKVNDAIKDTKTERKINKEFEKEKKSNKINISFIEYTSHDIPQDRHIEFLADIQHETGDIVATPILSGITKQLNGEKLLTTFLDVTNRFIESIEQINNRTIMGVVPYEMPRQYLKDIIGNYYEKGIHFLAIDLSGKSIDSNRTWLRRFFVLLKNFGMFEETLVYALNSYEGKFMKNKEEVLAKDFMASGYGVDILGLNHVPPRLPSEVWKRVKEQRKENTYRVFRRETYGYTKKPISYLIEMFGLGQTNLNKLPLHLRVYNINEQHKETEILQNALKEEPTLTNYIKKKEQVTEDIIKKIKKLKKKVWEGECHGKR